MLTIIIPGTEMFDETKQEFVTEGDITFRVGAFSSFTVKMGVNI